MGEEEPKKKAAAATVEDQPEKKPELSYMEKKFKGLPLLNTRIPPRSARGGK